MLTVCSFIPELQKKDSFSLHCWCKNSLSPTSALQIKKSPNNFKKSLATIFNRRLINICCHFTAGKTTQLCQVFNRCLYHSCYINIIAMLIKCMSFTHKPPQIHSSYFL